MCTIAKLIALQKVISVVRKLHLLGMSNGNEVEDGDGKERVLLVG